MEERTIIISAKELVDHAVLTRKRNELQFRKEVILKSGAQEGDLHLKALEQEIEVVESKLKPISEKLTIADILTVVPSRKEIEELTKKINEFSRNEIDAAIKNKSGAVYEYMKKRAFLLKNNYERREDIARLTIFLNTMPRKEAEELRKLIEEGEGEDVDVSFLTKEKQQELLNLAARLGRICCVFAGSFSIDKKKVNNAELKPDDEVKTNIGTREVWVKADKLEEFKDNEKLIAQLRAKIQAKNAEKESRELTEEEVVYLEKLQKDYLEAIERRSALVPGIDLSETAKVYKKVQKESEENIF